MADKKMIGAYVPETYEMEIVDKLQREFPGTPLTYLVRALLGLWFNGKIKLTTADLKRYRLDGRKYTVKPRQRIPEGVEGEGWKAAEENIPLLANPYRLGQEAGLWEQGWYKFYSTQQETTYAGGSHELP